MLEDLARDAEIVASDPVIEQIGQRTICNALMWSSTTLRVRRKLDLMRKLASGGSRTMSSDGDDEHGAGADDDMGVPERRRARAPPPPPAPQTLPPLAQRIRLDTRAQARQGHLLPSQTWHGGRTALLTGSRAARGQACAPLSGNAHSRRVSSPHVRRARLSQAGPALG